MNDIPNLPIQVDSNTMPLAAAARYLVTILGTFAVARGWVDADNVDGIITALVTLGTVGYGLWQTHQRKVQLVATASAAPDSVAVVK